MSKHVVTLNPDQIATLRLMLRLTLVRNLRRTLGGYKAGSYGEAYSINHLLAVTDNHQRLDMVLALAELELYQTRAPVYHLILDDQAVADLKRLVEFPYSTAQIPDADQAEQALALEQIDRERDDLRMALAQSQVRPPPPNQPLTTMKQ